MPQSDYCNPSTFKQVRINAHFLVEGESADGATVRSFEYTYPIDFCRSCLQPKSTDFCQRTLGEGPIIGIPDATDCFPYGTEDLWLACSEKIDDSDDVSDEPVLVCRQ